MKKLRLIFRDNGNCEKVLPAERWPETHEEAYALFEELLSDDGRFNGKLGLNGLFNKWYTEPIYDYGEDCKKKLVGWFILPGAAPCGIRGWQLQLVDVKERAATVIDMTDNNQESQYTYLVVYQFSKYLLNKMRSVIGEFACSDSCEVRLNKPINSIEDIRKIEALLEIHMPDTDEVDSRCTVTNFVLLNNPADGKDAE